MAAAQLQQLLATNRAEDLGYDVWRQFVIPPFFNRLSIGDTRKPQVIIGGRGCGKTMLLRYLSHESTFSPNREEIPQTALSHIGLYWRADTQFASLMQRRAVHDDAWAAAFRHLAALVLGAEVLRSLQSIASSSIGILREEQFQRLDFQRLRPFCADIPAQFQALHDFLEDSIALFESWVNDVRSVEQPRFLPGGDFVRRMIELIRDQLPELRGAVFFAYVDEYENLATYQQKIINTWLKHSEPPLVFNFAMKRNGFKTRFTEGDEALSNIHDYRDIDIEQFDLDADFPVFAAEILLLRLKLANLHVPDVNAEWLRDTTKLGARRQPSYVERVLSAVKNLFPSLTHHELALQALSDPQLRQRLVQRVTKALQVRGATLDSPEQLLAQESPEASIIVPALLFRNSLPVDDVKKEIERLRRGEANKFTGPTNWIHNNFVGCYLQLYDTLARPCPLYSGFTTFCFMSRGNLRHFLELSFRALGRLTRNDVGIGTVSVDMQAEAARQASAELLAEVRSFGPHGNNLHAFVLRLGSLFSLSQQQPKQSEPERTHFSIQGGTSEITGLQVTFLAEAIKWSVLFEEKGTKKKSSSDPEDVEYVLNPIYSPYFQISYRKRRKLELPANHAAILINGSYNEVKSLLSEYQQRWSVDITEASLPLFAHLTERDPE
jgi:hypothetical protein